MNPKYAVRQLMVFFLVAGMMVTSVSANPTKNPETPPYVEIPRLNSMTPLQEVAEPPTSLERYQPKTSQIQKNQLLGYTELMERVDPKGSSPQVEDPLQPTSFSASESMPIQNMIDSLPAGMITIDMTYDVVMGWVEPEQLVQVTNSLQGYGSAVADSTGFFWTPIWHNTDGHEVGIQCGTTTSISVDGTLLTTLTPLCFSDTHVVVLDDVIRGTLSGAGAGVTINASLGEFSPYVGSVTPAQGAPTGSATTDPTGFFEITNIGFDLGAESVAALDFLQEGVNIRDYVVPQDVFMVHQMNSIQGYTSVGLLVTATVYVGASTEVRWTGEMQATWPLGYYSFSPELMMIGDRVTVELSGESLLSTTVASLGNFIFDEQANTLQGQAANGAYIRAGVWQWQGESRHYSLQVDNADSSGFSIDFSPEDLKAYDNVLVSVSDSDGNQTQILSGAPFVNVLQDPLSNQDCVMGRLDAPNEPIWVRLDKGGDGTVDYVRETGWVSDAGNDFDVCFLIRHPNFDWGPINIDPGDIATLFNGSDWSESDEVINFDWDYNTATETITGQGFPEGEMEVWLPQYYADDYTGFGTATYNAEITTGEFSASFTNFDVRDGLSAQLTHYNNDGNGNTWYQWDTESLTFFELIMHQDQVAAVAGFVKIPDDLVTVSIYQDEFATEPLFTTSQDTDEQPHYFMIDGFGEISVLSGMRIVVSSASGWNGEMIVPIFNYNVNLDTNEISGVGPQGLLYLEAWREDQSLSLSIPTNNSSAIHVQTDLYGYDLHQGDFVSLTYVAPDGNRARMEWRFGDLYRVGHWLNDGRQDWMWGEAIPGSNITISINDGDPIQAYFEDPNCQECWGIHDPLDIDPGNDISISMDTGYTLNYSIPNPLKSVASSTLDTISGQIEMRADNWVNISTWWDGGEYQVNTAPDGTFILASTPELPIDVPTGGEGQIHFNDIIDDVLVDMSQHFRTVELSMNVNYDHDWIEGNYPPGYDVTLTVTESDGVTDKATTTLTTSEISWWGGQTGFSTNLDGVMWDPERPDIQPGDWVYGEVTVADTTYYSQVQLGTFAGELNAGTNTFTGTLDVSWLNQEQPVPIQCHPWGAPEGTPMIDTSVLPDGISEFTCDWTDEWDVQPDQQIAVSYQDPGGHWVYSVHQAYTDGLILRIQYDHNWIEGNYRPGHEIYLRVLDNAGDEKAHITLTSGYIDGWGSASGFSTNVEGATWFPTQPDIQQGDTIYGEVDDGAFTAEVKIGTVTADLDLLDDTVSGTVEAEWLPQDEEVKVSCEIWDWNSPPNQEDWVLPTGSNPYLCDWTSVGYNLDETSNLMVAYYESTGHKVIGEFRYPTPRLHINKWLEGGELGAGGTGTFNIQYRNEGNATALNTIITDTLGPGLSYLSDTSGFPKTVDGNQMVWQLGELAPGDWVNFYVYVHVEGPAGTDTFNTVVFSSDSVDGGNEWDRTSTWEGTISSNNTHVNVGKGTWTWLPAPGQNYVYNINVCNNGPTGSTELTMTETLPNAVTLVSWWGREVGWSEVSYTGNILTLEYPSIPGWSCREVYVKVHLDPAAHPKDQLINMVDIVAVNDDPDEHDNEAWYNHNVGTPFTDLSVSLGWHWGMLTPGGQYRFGIYFYNDSNIPVEGPIPLVLTLPPGVQFGGWSHWDWANFIGEPVVDGNTVTWMVDDLDPGYYGAIEVIANIDSITEPGTELIQTVVFTPQPGEEDNNDNTANLTEHVFDHGPNLRIYKRGDWHGFGEGHNARYELQVENVGDQTMMDVYVLDYYPTQMSLDGNISVNFGQGWQWQDFPDEHFFAVHFDRLEPGWNAGINYNVVIPGTEPIEPGLVFLNNALVFGDIADTNPEDDTALFPLGSGPDMFVKKSLFSGEFQPGEEVTYLLKFGNAQPGHAWWWNMTGIGILTDTLPAGMTFVSAQIHWSSDQPEWSDFPPAQNGQTLTWQTWPIAAGGWNEILLTVRIGDDVQDGEELTNQLVITSDQPTVDLDPFTENNISTYSGIVEVLTRYLYLPFILK